MSGETGQNDTNESIERLKVNLGNETDSLEANLDIAEYYLKNEKFDDAEPHILKALQIDKNNASAYNHLGIIYFHKGDFVNAESQFKKAINIAPNMVESYFNLGLLYQSQGRFAEALPFYKIVVTMEPDNAEAYYLMGQCAMCSEMFQEAKEFFKESFRLRPSPKTALDLSIIYISQEKYSEAEELLSFLIEDANSRQDKGDQYSDPDIESLNFTMGLVLKKQGKFIEAIKYFQKVVLGNDRHEQAFNCLGECCAEIDMEEEAESFFAKSTKLDPEYLQPIMNLGRLYFKQGRYYNAILAIERFLEIKSRMLNLEGKDIEKKHDADVEFAYEMLGKAYMQIGEREKAISIWQNSLKVNPSQPEIIQLINSYSNRSYTKANLSIDDQLECQMQADQYIDEASKLIEKGDKEIIKENNRKKIAFFCGPDDKFLNDIIDRLSSKYEITRFRGKTIQDMHNLMNWSDLSWFEWCDNLIIHAGKLPKVCKILCRLHSYEAFTDYIRLVNWENVDDLVFVAPHIKDIVLRQVPNLEKNVHLHIIFNGVDLKKYRFKERKKGFNIAFVGYINHKKNPSLLLQCMKYLVDIDDRYVLHIAGQHQELRFQLYFDHIIKEMKLDKNVIFHGWVNDVNKWLEDKHFTVSTSVLESFCYGIADAMACGIKPLIHNFIGAKDLYPEKYIFNTVQDFGKLVLEDDYNSFEYRKYIEEKYSQERQFEEIEKLISSII